MFDIVPFDRDPKQRAFIEDTFLRCVRQSWPWSIADFSSLKRDFQYRIRRPGARVALAVTPGDPDEFLGWAATDGPEIIFAYTLADYRSKGAFKPRVATTLVTQWGIDLSAPTPLRYWTPTAQILSERGYNLHPARTP